MAPLSSPLTYPPSSSPPPLIGRKRKRAPLLAERRKRENPGPFIIDEDEDEDEHVASAGGEWFGRIGSKAAGFRNASVQGNGPTARRVSAEEPRDRWDEEASLRTMKDLVIPGQQDADLSSLDCDRSDSTNDKNTTRVRTSSGKAFQVHRRSAGVPLSFQTIVATQSTNAPGRAKTSYYGIDIHRMLDEAAHETKTTAEETLNKAVQGILPSLEVADESTKLKQGSRTLMWTEKYRAKRFTDLVGDERTHRSVLRWLKAWDPIVFPGLKKSKPKCTVYGGETPEMPHRKIMLLTGPPGLGKTTLAHVCGRQAGYEILELNASDERSRDVVRGRIRDSVGTENVRGVNVRTADGTVRKAGRPVCVVVDEVDGAVGGSGANGEGGFIKELLDLIALDEKNTGTLCAGHAGSTTASKKKRKGDSFRLLRPLILICNDIYHPALRLLRVSKAAEVIHIRPPPLDKIVTRLKTVFELEHVSCDGDGVRLLCEATWGASNKNGSRAGTCRDGEGDMRGVMVVGEWVAGRLRASTPVPKLTRRWVEQHLLESLSHGGGGSRGIGRGGTKEIVKRVFQEGAGFPKPETPSLTVDFSGAAKVGVTEFARKQTNDRLREIIESSGECDRIVTDCFATYPRYSFQDDTLLSKPNAAYDWLHFHETLSSKVYTGQEWELMPYLSQPVLAFHQLFSATARQHWSSEHSKPLEDDADEPLPFSGPQADFVAFESEKHNRSILLGLQTTLNVPLLRSFRSLADIATDLVPRLVTMLTPEVHPVIVGGGGDQRGIASVRKESERELVRRAVRVMAGLGVVFERVRVETNTTSYGGCIYRMEP